MAIRKAVQDKQDEKAAIPLADFIGQLHDELDKAREAAQGKALQFDVGQIDIELAVQAQKEADGGRGLRIYLFEAGCTGRWRTCPLSGCS
jgi:Trypsin-co-occurring domain 2